MSDLAPDHFPGHPPVRAPGNDSDGFERGNATLIEQWAAVEDAARVVALLAGQPVGTDIWIALAWMLGILVVGYVLAMLRYRRRIR